MIILCYFGFLLSIICQLISAELFNFQKQNTSLSLWFQFQKKNINDSSPSTADLKVNDKPVNFRHHLAPYNLLKPNAKPLLPVIFPDIINDDQRSKSRLTDSSLLKQLLGRSNFNLHIMSIDKPKSMLSNFYLSKSYKLQQKKTRKLFFKQFRRFIKLRQSSMSGFRKFRRLLRQFLFNYSMCPVKYSWRDMGKYVWPRFIKHGSCYNSQNSCSYPNKSKCTSDKFKKIPILRWICLNKWRQKQCRWYKIYIPLLIRCKCGCVN